VSSRAFAGYRSFGKRMLDLVVTIPSLIVLAPVFLLVAAVVRATLGAPVLFRQARPGKDGRIFWIYKFRTMTDKYGPDRSLLADAERLTTIGTFLRQTSLDELPELWNVLKGEMSLVGPRPLLVEYLEYYSETQRRRHEVLPGVTGLAQVSGRNAITWEEKFALDVWYVDNVSLELDVTILMRTIARVIRREGVHADSHVSMPRFTGTKQA
jgi:lipopolysaccharide/colanic/teichoic acid biosynthesis glycosyltransferase